MSDIKIIALNGPPGSGKDTIADWLSAQSNEDISFVHTKFAAPLKQAVHALLPISAGNINKINKEQSLSRWDIAASLRELYILMSEDWAKPLLGRDILGRLWLHTWGQQVDQLPDTYWVISDCGFYEELHPLIEEFGEDAILLIHLERPDHTFENDSRDYLGGARIGYHVLHNNQTIPYMFGYLDTILYRHGINVPDNELSKPTKATEAAETTSTE